MYLLPVGRGWAGLAVGLSRRMKRRARRDTGDNAVERKPYNRERHYRAKDDREQLEREPQSIPPVW